MLCITSEQGTIQQKYVGFKLKNNILRRSFEEKPNFDLKYFFIAVQYVKNNWLLNSIGGRNNN